MSKMHNRATRRLESILNPGSAQRSLRNMVRSLVERQRKLLLMRSMRRTKNLRRSQTTKRRSVSLRKSLRSLWTVQETRRRVRQLPSNLRKRARSTIWSFRRRKRLLLITSQRRRLKKRKQLRLLQQKILE